MLDKFKSMLDEIKIVTYEFISVFDFNQQFSALRPLQSSEKKMGDLIKTLILHIKQDSVLSFPFPFIALHFDRSLVSVLFGQCPSLIEVSGDKVTVTNFEYFEACTAVHTLDLQTSSCTAIYLPLNVTYKKLFFIANMI